MDLAKGAAVKETNRPYHILVVELDETLPRRDPQKPHLYVAVSVELPEKRFAHLVAGKGPAGLRGRYVNLRPDLNPDHGDELTPDVADEALRALKTLLARKGHAINGSATKWSGYVIDLAPPQGMTDIGKGYVYVGQTQLTPEARFAVHKGPKPVPPQRDVRSKIVARRGIALNWTLMQSLTPTGPVFTVHDALELERTWATELFRRGYRVEAGDATPTRK